MNATTTASALSPVVKSIEVDQPLEQAFELFTARMAEWWPLASHSVGGADALWCGIEGHVGGRVLERTGSGAEHVWGTVTDWQPPQRVAFTWHPGQDPEPHTEVELCFAAIAEDRTRVTLEHRGWDALGDRAGAVRGRYTEGWDVVLGRCPDGVLAPSDERSPQHGSPA